MYSARFTRQTPGCFLFLLDQSGSMTDPFGGNASVRKCDQLALALNSWLQNMVVKCTGGEGVRDYANIGVFGYRTDAMANPIIEPCLKGPLAEQPIVRISDIEANVARIDTLNQQYYDPDTGELQEMPTQVPIWIDPVADGGTPMCTMFHYAYQVLENWCAEHPSSFPPLVIHISDGESSEGDPLPYVEAIQGLGTEDGNVLFINCHLSMTKADPLVYPASSEVMPDEWARTMFNMSSVLPESIVSRAQAEGIPVQSGSRAMVFNADMVNLLQLLDFGTMVANLR